MASLPFALTISLAEHLMLGLCALAGGMIAGISRLARVGARS